MEPLKKIIKIIFGRPTPMQLFLGCLLGSILGFVPGFSYAPLLIILSIFLIIILSVNIGFVVIISLITKMLSFGIEPISFHLGIFLLEGFTQPLFKFMINTPVLAYVGFDYYLVTGSFVIALIFGVASGFVMVKIFTSIRNKMSTLQSQSELYQKLVNKFWVKCATWILLGKSAHKVDWIELKEKKLKHPFRLTGVITVIILIGILLLSQRFLQSQMVANILKTQLTKINGATVDFKKLSVDLIDAKLDIQGLAIANPDNSYQDRFYAENLAAKINIKSLLKKRLMLSEVVIDQVLTDHKRDSKASLSINTPSTPREEPPAKIPTVTKPVKPLPTEGISTFEIEKYIKNTKKYSEYLGKIKRISTVIASGEQSKSTDDPKRIAEAAKIYGYANIQAKFLIEKTPTLTIQKLLINNIKTAVKSVLTLNAVNLATEPRLLNEPTVIDVYTKDQSIDIKLVDFHQSSKNNTIDLKITDIPAEDLFDNINFNQGFDIEAKSYSINSLGIWQIQDNGTIAFNIPIQMILHGVRLKISGSEQKIEKLPLKLTLVGNLNAPTIQLDQQQLQKLFVDVGVSALKSRLKDQFTKLPKKLWLIMDSRVLTETP